MKDLAVVWVPLSGIKKHLSWLPPAIDETAIYLPFIRDANKDDSEGISYSVSPGRLLFSILIFFQDNPPTAVMGIVRRYLVDVLNVLVRGFEEENLESLVMNACAQIRGEFGISASYRALKSSLEILPESNAAKSDFIVCSWCMMLNQAPDKRNKYAARVIEVFPTMAKEQDYLGAWQACVLTEILALAVMGDYGQAIIFFEMHKEDLEDPADQKRMEKLVTEKLIDVEDLDQPAFDCKRLESSM